MKAGENVNRKRPIIKAAEEIRSPEGVGRPLKLKDVPRAIFSGISPVAFSEMTAQAEYVKAHKHGIGFTGNGEFFHYQFFPTLLEPNLREKVGKADVYIWTIGKNVNTITPISDCPDWTKVATFLEMAMSNAKRKGGK